MLLACGDDAVAPSRSRTRIRFEQVSESLGIDYVGPTWGLAVGDFDGDGRMDLYSSNHASRPRLFRESRMHGTVG